MSKNAIVTGGSRGIGKAICFELASRNNNIIIIYRSSDDEAEKLKNEIISKYDVKVETIKADVANFKDAQEIVSRVNEEFGSVDILVNSAGITRDKLLMRMKEEDFDDVIDVNLKGTFNYMKAVTNIMLKQRSGKIINISSVVGVTGNAGQLNYAASKAGIIAMTKSLAKEIGSRGININAIAPGFIETDMTSVLSEKITENVLKNIPLNRFGKAEEVASLVGFLSSNEASYITGQVISIDGGII